jgi:hypothetical protein
MPWVQIPHRPRFDSIYGDNDLLLGGFAVIVLLTWTLVGMNVRAVVRQYQKDQNVLRLYSYLVTLLIVGSMIIGVSSSIVQRVIDAETFLHSEDASSPIRHYQR